MSQNDEIIGRLRQFGDDKYGSMAEFARALGVSPQSLNKYLSGGSTLGATMRERLLKIDCDIEWLMTGVSDSNKKEDETVIRLFGGGQLTDEQRKRIERVVEMMKNGSPEDAELFEKLALKLFSGK